ncbi:MAG: adenosine deaminase [Stygiobacter sp.]|nr:MAG: adenosine deaminase [Stygiobacter sp.]
MDKSILQLLPKIELHLHLDCSLSYDVVKKLNPQINYTHYKNNFIAPEKCLNLGDFLRCTNGGIDLMQTEVGLKEVVKDLFVQLKKESSTGIKAGIILCTLRHYNEEQSLQTVKLVEKFIKNSVVVGFDIAANEAGFPIDSHKKAFEYAIKKDIPRTAHAGEAKGAESVWETIKYFSPQRIGHGVRSIEDDTLIEYLIKKNIHLEVCPSCNIQINVFDKFSDHPINNLYNSGVSVGINTDARSLVNVSLSDEYLKLIETFGWGYKHFYSCNKNALSASFLEDSDKTILREKLDTFFVQNSILWQE